MHQTILQHVHALAAERGVRILYACETGSRGWGFASPDSDYDVRFVFAHPLRRYLSIQEPQSDINTFLDADGEVLDLNGWDLRKFLRLLARSNATPFEWLQSPIVYEQEAGFRETLWALAPGYFQPRAGVHHYLGICHNSIKTGIADGNIKIKKYFYILRPLLAAIWAADRQSVPPMEFRPLLQQIEHRRPLMEAIQALWAEKEKAAEAQVIQLIPVIQEFVEQEMERCRDVAATLTGKNADTQALDDFFQQHCT